ncbi:MAG: helix-turn-helix domain-containing protein [Eggerthellaceae bacterium]|nr:helix-turn-helix domain-containing protein [Eggerthellaceae bacterium]
MTTAEASAASGLSAHRVGCLARAGEIGAVKSGNTILVDAASLQSYAAANQGRGRPLDARTAYAALWLLSGLEAGWLSYAQSRRLRLRLQAASAESLSWQLRKRAETRRYRASDSFLGGVAGSLHRSGASSARLAEFGLLQASGTAEGYCLSEDVGRLEASFYLVEDPHGNVVVHAAPWLPDGIGAEMPAAVTAADLVQSMDTREREAGLGMLRRLLDEHRDA